MKSKHLLPKKHVQILKILGDQQFEEMVDELVQNDEICSLNLKFNSQSLRQRAAVVKLIKNLDDLKSLNLFDEKNLPYDSSLLHLPWYIIQRICEIISM